MTEITTPRYKGQLEPVSAGFNDLSVVAERSTHGTAGVKDFSGAKLFFAKKNWASIFPSSQSLSSFLGLHFSRPKWHFYFYFYFFIFSFFLDALAPSFSKEKSLISGYPVSIYRRESLDPIPKNASFVLGLKWLGREQSV